MTNYEAEEKKFDNEQVYIGQWGTFTRTEMSVALKELTQNLKGWKYPIDCTVTDSFKELVTKRGIYLYLAAIDFSVGGQGQWDIVGSRRIGDEEVVSIRITAPGYYSTIGA